MGSVLDLLNKIVKPGQIAAISLTGLISAFAVALLLWPPPPKDVIHVPAMDKTRKTDGPDYCRLDTKDLEVAKDPGKFKSVAVDNQFTLDQGLENVQRCLDFKNSQVGAEATEDKQLTDEITVLKVEQTAAQNNYLNYQKAGSPLQNEFYGYYIDDTRKIEALQKKFIENEQKIRDQQYDIDEYTESLNIIKQRLQDPGRLRPTHSFDDVLQGLANHVVAFLGLAVVIGTAVQPLQRVFLGGFDYPLKTN